MSYIKTLTSEADLVEKFFTTLRERRVVNQYMHYLGDGAEVYYNIANANKIPSLEGKDEVYTAFISKNLPKEAGDTYGFVSLGCGNGKREKAALTFLQKEKGHHIHYVGVDTSIGMLELAEKEFADMDMEKTLISADFASDALRYELNEIFPENQHTIFAFLGSTIGNFQVDYSADLISDVMHPGDYLWMDVDIRLAKDALNDRKLYEFFRDYIRDEHNISHKFMSLEKLGIHPSMGELYIEMTRDDALGALIFFYKFRSKETITISHRNKQMCLLPDNTLTLQTYIVYYPQDLIKYFEQRNFEYIASDSFNNEVGQFLFVKKG